jgi:hypothetical protein
VSFAKLQVDDETKKRKQHRTLRPIVIAGIAG